MGKISATGLLLFLCMQAAGQQDTVFIKQDSDWTDGDLTYVTDTVIFDSGMTRQILKGTTVLPSTHNQMMARGFGLYFSKVAQSDCQKGSPAERAGTDMINSVLDSDSSLIIDMNVVDNCCYSFLCDIEVTDDSVLNLIYIGYGNYCACDCCFGLTYTLLKEKSPDYGTVKAVMINRNRKTFRKLN